MGQAFAYRHKYPDQGIEKLIRGLQFWNMRVMRFALVFLLPFMQCNKANSYLPKEPQSVAEARSQLMKGVFTVEQVGLGSAGIMDEPLQWMNEQTDTAKDEQRFIKDRKSLALHFINETEVALTDNQRNIQAQYQLEKDATKTVLMKLTFEDKTFSFPGSNEPMKLTYTYRIRGIDENRLLLETPRQYNYRPVVLLMKKK